MLRFVQGISTERAIIYDVTDDVVMLLFIIIIVILGMHLL